jgi:hypothetical protein
MSLYRNLFSILILCLVSSFAFSQEEAENTSNDKLAKSFTRSTVSISYMSWTEQVDFESPANVDRGFANFYGNAISFEREIYNKKRTGFALEAGILSGLANVGGSQRILVYQDSYKKYLGAMASARYAYRHSSVLTFSIGPMALYRQVTIPVLNGVSAKSGNDLNYGLLAEMAVRLGENLEFRQSFGTLSFKASALWSLGLGYKF